MFSFRFFLVKSSYLDVPRIHFAGQFRADVSYFNNCPCNFDVNLPRSMDTLMLAGTNEWELVNTKITSVFDSGGEEVQDGPLIGAEVFSNEGGPRARVVDFDVDLMKTSFFGLKVGVRVGTETLFIGNWVPSVVTQEMWTAMKCSSSSGGDGNIGTSSTSRITNVTWFSSNDLQSALKCSVCTGELSVAIFLHSYSQTTYGTGNITGTIGVAKRGEPLQFGGNRKLVDTNANIDLPKGSTYAKYKIDGSSWVHTAPFIIDKTRNKLVVDIGNTFSIDCTGAPINLGQLWFGILGQDQQSISILGDSMIPYTDARCMSRYGGVIEQVLSEDAMHDLEQSQLVIVKEVSKCAADSSECFQVKTPPSLRGSGVQVLLKEATYFIRPMGYYMDRLEYSNPEGMPVKNLSDMTLLVSQFGTPAKDVTVCLKNHLYFPEDGVSHTQETAITDENGLATFTFTVNIPIPQLRKYKQQTGTSKSCCPKDFDITENLMPIDGQIYLFYYYVGESDNCKNHAKIIWSRDPQVLAFKAYSTMYYQRPYTWVKDVQPIFQQYGHIYSIMHNILDLSDYEDVTRAHNVRLLNMSMSKDFTDPNYMPVTRDLSPTKRSMILEWLSNPLYDQDSKKLPPSTLNLTNSNNTNTIHFNPHVCKRTSILYTESIRRVDPYFEHVLKYRGSHTQSLRPLDVSTCSLDNLKDQLQLATQIEFATLPLYLTSLYSIKEHYNTEAYSLMRGIVMQEMLHYVLASNILIAIGGSVKLDDPDIVPKYPSVGLPGGVLPQLRLELKKFSLEHTYYTFMALESPAESFLLPKYRYIKNTVGHFYREILDCMGELGDGIFLRNTTSKQVNWPLMATGPPQSTGHLPFIIDLKSAQDAIVEIAEQGEGASPLAPEDGIKGQYAHFYRFAEIACQRKLVFKDGSYSFTGEHIPHDPTGIWQMMDSPNKDAIQPGTLCYRQANAFHKVYRNLLTVMEEAFNGAPEKMLSAVELMESLQVHFKKTMWTPYDSTTTCGPVWDYEWE